MNQVTIGVSIREIKSVNGGYTLVKGYNQQSYKRKNDAEYKKVFINVEFFMKTEEVEKLKLEVKDSIIVSGKAQMKSEQSKDDDKKYFNALQVHFPSVQKVYFGYGFPNHITVTGNIGSQEIKIAESGKRFNRISIAVDGGKKKDSDERDTWWMSCFIPGEKSFSDENGKLMKGKITIEGTVGEQSINVSSFWFKPSDEHAASGVDQANESTPQAEADDLPF